MLGYGIVALAILGGQVNQSLNLDNQSIKKNIKAFTKTADAQKKLNYYNQRAFQQLETVAKRKHGILVCHLKMFQEQFAILRNIQFEKGKGIEEIEKIDEIQKQVHQYIALPAVVNGTILTDGQLLVSVALRGIGGQMIKDSKQQLKLASANVSQANAITAQIDSMCIVLDGITKHAEIISKLLEKLGMVYMQSIKNITRILQTNGMNPNLYSNQDMDAINLSLDMTKLIYRIINTPIIDNNGNIEQASIKVLNEGQCLLNQI